MSPTSRRKTTPPAGDGPDEQAASATGSQRKPRSVYIDEAILDRARAATVYLSSYVPESNIGSLSDMVEPGLLAEVKKLEKKYNNGEPFPPVSKMPTGRPRQK